MVIKPNAHLLLLVHTHQNSTVADCNSGEIGSHAMTNRGRHGLTCPWTGSMAGSMVNAWAMIHDSRLASSCCRLL
jgi:hypothetical protein